MTALNFLIQKNQICFAIDSLSVSPEDKKPLNYLTKFIILPHVSMAVTGTGHGGLVCEWMRYVRSNIARDIDHIDMHVPIELRYLSDRFPELDKFTATIYHFGYSNSRDRYVGYVYRSTNNWESEELPEGIGIKPIVDVGLENNFELPSKFVEIMKLQRSEDLKLPIEKQVGIGGDVHFVQMANGIFNISRCFRFPSYESDYETMRKRHGF